MVVSASLPDRFQALQLIARGGCGVVYRALDRQTGQPVAVKQVLTTAGDAALAQALQREALMLRGLRHPRLPAYVDFFADDASCCLVMAYVEGDDLGRQLERRDGPFPVAQALAWAGQLLETLTYLHSQQPPVIHRDIKPANLKVNQQGQVILLDFGLAKGAGATLHSLPGYTLNYAPPEQLRGDRTDASSDLYSLGATLYHLISGMKPPDALRREAALLDGQPDPLTPAHLLHAQISPALSDVLHRSLALDRCERFHHADQMQQALQQALAEPATRIVAGPDRASRTPHNLPAQLTPLIGREQEVAAVQALLRRADVRLVTLTGVGGIGKTRLALASAAGLLADFPDGVYFASLIEATEPDQATAVVARALGVQEKAGRPLLDGLLDVLRQGRRLLVLDNFEHILEAAPLATTLLSAAPGLTVLATSRERLNLRGERVYIVPPLATPPGDLALTPASAASYAALALFAARAQAVWPDFLLDTSNIQAVAQLCQGLDGLPLAIELAAARIQTLTPAAMHGQLAERFNWLDRGPRDAPTRQRSMMAAIDWSYDLLNQHARRLWQYLAVFVAGCDAEAIEFVARQASLPAENLPSAVQSLVDQHILRPGQGRDGGRRYVMLETLRSYGLRRLAQEGMADDASAAMVRYCRQSIERAAPELVGPQARVWLQRLDDDHPNYRAVLRWAIDQGDGELALSICVGIWRYWRARGLLQEGRQWFRQALAVEQPIPDALRAKAYNKAGVLAYEQADLAEAQALEELALSLQRLIDDRWGLVSTLNMLGVIAMERSRYDEADRWLVEALAVAREVNHAVNGAHVRNNLGLTAIRRGRSAQAAQYFEESLAEFERLHDRRSVALLRGNLGEALHRLGRSQDALALLASARAEWSALGDVWGEAANAIERATVLCDLGDLAQATILWQDAMNVMTETGSHHHVGRSLAGLGLVALRQARYQDSARLLREAQSLFERIGDHRTLSYVVGDLADLALACDDHETAQSLCQRALQLAQQTNDSFSQGYRLCQLARLATLRGEWSAAQEQCHAAISLHRQLANDAGEAMALRLMAAIALQRHDHQHAEVCAARSVALVARLGYRLELALSLEALADAVCARQWWDAAIQCLGAADTLRSALQTPRNPLEAAMYQRIVAAAQGILSPAAYAEAYARGARQDLDSVLAPMHAEAHYG